MVSLIRTDIVPVQIEDVAKKPAADKIIPGRVVRRAKRQTSSQTSYEGTSKALVVSVFFIELGYSISSKIACVPNINSDQPTHSLRLIRVFTGLSVGS